MAVAAFAGAGVLLSSAAIAAPGDTIGPINPVAQPLGSHAANSGFLVFVDSAPAPECGEAPTPEGADASPFVRSDQPAAGGVILIWADVLFLPAFFTSTTVP